MRCDHCHKSVPDDATIWRVSCGYNVHHPPGAVQSWCAACVEDAARRLLPPEAWPEDARRRLLARHAAMWHPEQPCDHCGRPVIFNSSRRIPLHAVCGTACRYAIKLAQARARRSQRRSQVTCQTCGERFVPKRADALTCSSACRQRAYRQRQHAKAA